MLPSLWQSVHSSETPCNPGFVLCCIACCRLREHNDPQRCAEELVAEALRMHSSDNITVICCCFGEERPKRRIYGTGRFGRSVSRQGLDCITAALGEQQLQ